MRRLLVFATSLAALVVVGCGSPSAASTSAAHPTPSCSPRPAGSPPAGFAPGRGQGPSGAGQGAFGGAGRPVATGQVDAYSGGVMTVSDRRTGQSLKVTVTSSTEVTSGFGGRSSTATPVPARIAKGENVTVFGSQASDGSITATRVTVLAALQCGRAPRTRGSPSPQG